MVRAHDVKSVSWLGATLILRVDGGRYQVDITRHSRRLADASPQQRERFEVSPSGYGLRWPDLDEDLSVPALLRASEPVEVEPVA